MNNRRSTKIRIYLFIIRYSPKIYDKHNIININIINKVYDGIIFSSYNIYCIKKCCIF